MAKFNKGDSIIEVLSNRKGNVVSVGAPSRGRQCYEVLFAGSDAPDIVLENYLVADFDISDPYERVQNGSFSTFHDFARINTSYKLENSSNSTIASLKASKTIFKAYQFKPLLKFINSENRRILVADEVGLGKTIEAGHIMLELQARKEFRNVLIVCPKSLRVKWQSEMKEKFNIYFKIYDTAEDLKEDIKQRNGAFRGIINYERLQYPAKEEKQKNPKLFLNIFKETGILFSLVLCDEAHKMRNSNTATYRGSEMLASMAKSLVFLTATPIMIDDTNLYNLLHLLSPLQYDNPIEFHNSLSLNQPFLQALRELRTTQSLPTIAKSLKDTSVELSYRMYDENSQEYYNYQIVKIDEYYAENPLYHRAIDMMQNEEDTNDTRAKIQQDLTAMSELNNIFSRTRRREITTDWTQAERHPQKIEVNLNPVEREIFDDVIEQYIDDNSYTDEWGEEKLYQGAQLGLVSKKRQVASNVFAYKNDVELLKQGIDLYEDYEDTKVKLLLELFEKIFNNGEKKIIVFAIYTKTLLYLDLRLKKAGYNCAVIYGGMKDRDSVLANFKNNDDIKILLSSEVGSEGLDMQFCCSMVNFDLPWNPMVVEQRIGRIDRFGQKSPVVKIFNLIVKDSIQEDIYERLLMRIGIFESSIGDLEAILEARMPSLDDDSEYEAQETIQSAYTKLEKDFFYNKLTAEERERKIYNIAQAIANEKQHLQQIEDSQTNTLTVDTYFQNEVNRILTTHSYLTENELCAYIKLLITRYLTTCELVDQKDGSFLFRMPKANARCLTNFITQFLNYDTPDGPALFSEFKRKIDDRTEFLLTFNQEVAYNNRDIIYINNTHPIIQAALNYFKKDYNPNDKTFIFDLSKELIPEELNESSYFLAIFSIDTSYIVQGVNKETNVQYPVLYDWLNDEVITQEDVVMKFMGQAQVYGTFHYATSAPQYTSEHIQNMKYAFAETIADYMQNKKTDLEINLRSQQNIKLSQLEKFHEHQVKARLLEYLRRAENALANALYEPDRKNAERNIKSYETQLINADKDYQEKRSILQKDFELKLTSKMVSLNLINIV